MTEKTLTVTLKENAKYTDLYSFIKEKNTLEKIITIYINIVNSKEKNHKKILEKNKEILEIYIEGYQEKNLKDIINSLEKWIVTNQFKIKNKMNVNLIEKGYTHLDLLLLYSVI